MKIAFKEYDRGNARAYFKSNKLLFCMQINHENKPEILSCSKSGEPCSTMSGMISFTLTNMTPNGEELDFDSEFVALFSMCDSCGDAMRVMSLVFGRA